MVTAVPTGTPLDYINAGSSLLNAVGGLSKQAQPGIATSESGAVGIKTDVDFSQWTVATGGSTAKADNTKKTSDETGTTAAASSAALGGLSPITMIVGAVALGLVVRMMKK